MTMTVTKKLYLEHLLILARAMRSAFSKQDLDMAAQIFDERERYIEKHEPDQSTAPEGLVDQLLKLDQELILTAQKQRQAMIASGSHLQAVRSYTDSLLPARRNGDWGSG